MGFVLYVMGGIIKKCGIGKKLTAPKAWIGTVVLCLTAWLWRLYGPEFGFRGVWVGQDIWTPICRPWCWGLRYSM